MQWRQQRRLNGVKWKMSGHFLQLSWAECESVCDCVKWIDIKHAVVNSISLGEWRAERWVKNMEGLKKRVKEIEWTTIVITSKWWKPKPKPKSLSLSLFLNQVQHVCVCMWDVLVNNLESSALDMSIECPNEAKMYNFPWNFNWKRRRRRWCVWYMHNDLSFDSWECAFM